MHQDEISRKATSDDNVCVTKLITKVKHKWLDFGKALYVRNLPGDTAKKSNHRGNSVMVKSQINFSSFTTVQTQRQSAPTSLKSVSEQLPTGSDSKRLNHKDAYCIKQPGEALHSEGTFTRRHP